MPDDRDELAEMANPNCPLDLVPMEVEGDGLPRWVCPVCGLVAIASK
jgi:hypothetical protein